MTKQLAQEGEMHIHYCPKHMNMWSHTSGGQGPCELGDKICIRCEAMADYENRQKGKVMSGEPAISKEIAEFASVMTSRQRGFDEELGTNNYITDTNIDEANSMLQSATKKLGEALILGNKVNAKVYAVDVANCVMIVWSKL